MNVQTHEQRLAHLEQANTVRLRRSQWKRRLHAQDATITDVMGDPMADGMKVVDVLLAVPKVGRVKAQKTLRTLGLSPTSTLGNLTYRQRSELSRCFR